MCSKLMICVSVCLHTGTTLKMNEDGNERDNNRDNIEHDLFLMHAEVTVQVLFVLWRLTHEPQVNLRLLGANSYW